MNDIGALFSRSSQLLRTPPNDAASVVVADEASSSTRAVVTTPVARPTVEMGKRVANSKNWCKFVEALETAKALHEYTNGRNNDHKGIKRMVKQIVAALSAYEREQSTTEPLEGVTSVDGLVSPNPTPIGTVKRSRLLRSPEEAIEANKKQKSGLEPVVSAEGWLEGDSVYGVTRGWRTQCFHSDSFLAALSLGCFGSAPTSAAKLVRDLSDACDTTMPRRRPPSRKLRPKYWWNQAIKLLRMPQKASESLL
ncbi:gag-like protein [Anopheles sinensis]|uniref:Gag-like protein n=1 Tax=Anopheles sinensis TaxID=74873 RepID=A0A084VCK7_ANOSI|nr:gag-like protein [Anopheles sinensis]